MSDNRDSGETLLGGGRWRRRKIVLPVAAAVLVAALGVVTLIRMGTSPGQESAPEVPASGGSPSGAAATCGTVNLAVNTWVGYEADAAVYAYVAKTRLGCTVVKKDLRLQVSWQGLGTGDVDLLLENWGFRDLEKKYITEQKVAVDLGLSGNKGIIGWYIPPWLAQAHPDITNWHNLNKYAADFKTSESSGKGQLLDAASSVTNDAALVKNLKLDFTVVQGGSEAALIQSFRTAEAQKKFFLAYFYEPHWFFDEMKLVRVNLPAYTPGCDSIPAKVACGYPQYDLNKVAATKFVNSGSPAATLAKNFNWTNDDQNVVAKYIVVDKMSDDEAAKKWVDANPDKVKAWLPAT